MSASNGHGQGAAAAGATAQLADVTAAAAQLDLNHHDKPDGSGAAAPPPASGPVTLSSWDAAASGGGGSGSDDGAAQPSAASTSTEGGTGTGSGAGGDDAEPSLKERDEMLSLLKQPTITEMLLSSRAAAGGRGGAAAPAAAAAAGDAATAHKFWDTQPVPKMSAPHPAEGDAGPLDPSRDVSAVRAEPYALPGGFAWCSIDVYDPAQLREMYELLSENYVEDDDNMFRFNYGPEFLLWALTPPGYHTEWHVGVRTIAGGGKAGGGAAATSAGGGGGGGKLVACITGVPVDMVTSGRTMAMCEINFLCNHKKLRAKRLAPVLIKEVGRKI